MKKNEIIDFALNRCCCSRDDELRLVLTRPFDVTDAEGWVCATNKKTILFVSKGLGADDYEPCGGGKALNVKPLLDDIFPGTPTGKYLDLQNLLTCTPGAYYDINGCQYLGERLLEAAEALSALGCSHLEILDSKHTDRLYFSAGKGRVRGILMACIKQFDHEVTILLPVDTGNTDCDFEKGEAFIAAFHEIRAQEEIRRKKNCKCFAVVFAKYSSVCVEAETLEEAEKLAEKYKYYVKDFEDGFKEAGTEVDSFEEDSDPEDYDQIITRDGVVSMKEFLEKE